MYFKSEMYLDIQYLDILLVQFSPVRIQNDECEGGSSESPAAGTGHRPESASSIWRLHLGYIALTSLYIPAPPHAPYL